MKSAARLIRLCGFSLTPRLGEVIFRHGKAGTALAVSMHHSKPLKWGANERVPGSRSAAFTLAEVLAALLIMAIVIPVAVQGLQIANRAAEVAQRKSQAARIAERVLNENIVTTNWNQSSQVGTVYEGTREFRWTFRTEPWSQNLTNQIPAEMTSMGQLVRGQPQVTATAASQTTL